MNKIITFLLIFSLLLCFVSCKNDREEDQSAYEIYRSAFDLTSALEYQKSSLTANGSDYPTLCRLIKKDGKITFYSERTVSVSNETDTVTPVLYHHYINGVMYQTFATTKMKHELSCDEFEKKYLDFDDIMLVLPEELLGNILPAENSDGGYTLALTFRADKLSDAEYKKLEKILALYAKQSFDGKYSIDSATLEVETTFDGYFDSYTLSFTASGGVNGENTSQKVKISLDIICPGNEFVINALADTDEYIEGSLEID